MSAVELIGVSVGPRGARWLDAMTLSIDDGLFVGVIGPSGSGKSTLLRVIAGLAPVDEGVIRIGGVDVTSARPNRRDVTMVPERAALVPHRSVRRNISLPLERAEYRKQLEDRVGAEARALHIDHLLDANPSTLSVGEAQLVQIARALVRVPGVLLLDDPFAVLDPDTRRRLRPELRALQEGYGVTAVMTTNDPADLAGLATHLVELDHGTLTAFGATADHPPFA